MCQGDLFHAGLHELGLFHMAGMKPKVKSYVHLCQSSFSCIKLAKKRLLEFIKQIYGFPSIFIVIGSRKCIPILLGVKAP